MSLDERARGILSPADRRYLQKPKEYSKQAGYERRRAIVERLHEALHDMPLLVSELDEDLRTEAFEDGDLDGKEHTLNVLSWSFALLYLGITDTVEPSDLAKDAFEGIAERVRQAYLQRGYSVEEVEVEVNVKRGEPLDELREREPDELSYPEVNQLLESGELSHLTGEEQMARIKEAWESGNTDKVGAFPNLELRDNADE
uniref:Domain of unknown function domain-containing protein n=1 Tax=Haloferax volcanii (strain ATCC 29605 / DSM 3757 / JCM 8879 / NBRC 14742 / NCIMB 2012 / VKM B-1768 / DS2) TaxID=309800 RepID=Q52048_HALVD|nr:hypothetical protein [Haloferax volcanii]AAA88100.1 unknown protein [Haloferax volcanii DS2]